MKAQVAMEYIVTYGWALLAVVVLIGGLSYFGVFRPNSTLPDNCFFTQDIECFDYRIVKNETGGGDVEIEIYLKNLDKKDLKVDRVQCQIEEYVFTYPDTPTNNLEDAFPRPEDFDTGEGVGLLKTNRQSLISCKGSAPSITKDTKYRAEIILDVYTDVSFTHQLRGEIFTKVQ